MFWLGFNLRFQKKNSFKKYLLAGLFIFSTFSAGALKIRFPDEELAPESVLPLVEPPRMVLNRNIPLKFRVEVGLGAGFGLDEPFYFPAYGAGMLAFHFSELHALTVTGTYFPPALSSAGKSLAQAENLDEPFDPLKAPYPQMMVFANYQYSPYYGKISLTKNWIMNLSIYAFAGPGLLVFKDNNRTLVGNLGIGQKLYFNKWIGIRGDLGFYGYYGPAVAKLKLNEGAVQWNQITTQQKRLIINIVANIGLIFLI